MKMDITRDFIENTIVNIIKNIAKTKTNIVADTNLGKLGFDSLSVIAVILDLEYALNIDNPYTKPYTDLVWRMDHGSTGAYHKRHELITDGVVSLTSYSLRYIKRPLVIDIVAKNTCELDPLAHDDVVDLAVQIAIKAKSLVQNVQPKQ